jgi:hypothetical protein
MKLCRARRVRVRAHVCVWVRIDLCVAYPISPVGASPSDADAAASRVGRYLLVGSASAGGLLIGYPAPQISTSYNPVERETLADSNFGLDF